MCGTQEYFCCFRIHMHNFMIIIIQVEHNTHIISIIYRNPAVGDVCMRT